MLSEVKKKKNKIWNMYLHLSQKVIVEETAKTNKVAEMKMTNIHLFYCIKMTPVMMTVEMKKTNIQNMILQMMMMTSEKAKKAVRMISLCHL